MMNLHEGGINSSMNVNEYNKKNIVFVMYVLGRGGAEKALMSTLDNIDYSKYNVDLIVLAKEDSYLYNINKNVNVRYIYDTYDLLIKENSMGRFNLKFEKDYDIEIGYFSIFTAWVISKFGNPKAKKIAWLHGDFKLMINNNYSVEYVNDLYSKMDKIICVSEGVKNSVIDFAGHQLENKLEVICNIMDIDEIRRLSLENINYKKSKFTIVSIGRLSYEKGFDRLIKVHKKLIDEGILNEVIILGDGIEENNLKKMINDFGVEDSCKLIPYQKNPYPWIKMCDIFVSSSVAEGLGIVLIEAMILKKNIVATNTYGSRELFKNDLGLIVNNSEEGLYNGLKSMILNKDIRELYEKNINKVEKFEFDKSVVMPQIEKLFEEEKIINKKSILFVVNHLLEGGAEKALINTLDYIDYSKYNVDLVVLIKEPKYAYDINENVNVRYIYESYELLNKDNENKNLIVEFEKEYDVEIAYLGMLTIWVISKFGTPSAKKITWLHCDIGFITCKYSPEYINDLYGKMDKIICVSEGVKNSFIDAVGNKLENKLDVILNLINVEKIQELSLEKIDYKKDKFTILAIGRLSYEKGFERLIKIHKKLLDESIEHELVILGDGDEKQKLINMINNLNIENSCKLMLYQKNPYPFIKMCDLVVSSSYSEGLPLVLIESMILRKPIVATDTHGSKTLFKDNLGLMVDNTDEALYHGIKNMILDNESRKSYIKNLNEVEKFEFDKSIVMPKIEKLFEKEKTASIKDEIEILSKKSDYYLINGDYCKARETLYKMFEYKYPKSKVLYKIAFIFESEKRYIEAINWYEYIFKLNIQKENEENISEGYCTWKPHLQLSVCYYKLNNKEKYLYHHNQAYKINPSNSVILANEKFFKSI